MDLLLIWYCWERREFSVGAIEISDSLQLLEASQKQVENAHTDETHFLATYLFRKTESLELKKIIINLTLFSEYHLRLNNHGRKSMLV